MAAGLEPQEITAPTAKAPLNPKRPAERGVRIQDTSSQSHDAVVHVGRLHTMSNGISSKAARAVVHWAFVSMRDNATRIAAPGDELAAPGLAPPEKSPIARSQRGAVHRGQRPPGPLRFETILSVVAVYCVHIEGARLVKGGCGSREQQTQGKAEESSQARRRRAHRFDVGPDARPDSSMWAIIATRMASAALADTVCVLGGSLKICFGPANAL